MIAAQLYQMKNIKPIPTKPSILARLADSLPITSIVDVGVRECTSDLISQFPLITHYLFEPVSLFFSSIKKHYSKINYQLFPIALSDENNQLYLVLSALNKDGKVSHSKISNSAIEVDGMNIVDCQRIDVRRFDSLDVAKKIEPDFLLKVDVDGKDLNVLRGFGDMLQLASVVIVECTYVSVMERMTCVRGKGFELVDIVDLVYYGQSLYQFDAVFVRKDLINSDLRPPISAFKRDLWSPLDLS